MSAWSGPRAEQAPPLRSRFLEPVGDSLPMSVLSALRSLPICRSVYREDTLPENARPCQRDRITLGWEERLKARARRTSDGGLQFGTALQRGSVLRAGD